jgi:hypothetical protein
MRMGAAARHDAGNELKKRPHPPAPCQNPCAHAAGAGACVPPGGAPVAGKTPRHGGAVPGIVESAPGGQGRPNAAGAAPSPL